MGTKDKLIERFKRMPKDFTWEELVRLMGCFGYRESAKGKTSGSRVSFVNDKEAFDLHKPHPGNIIKRYAMLNIYNLLKQRGLI